MKNCIIDMKMKVIYNNTTSMTDLEADWKFLTPVKIKRKIIIKFD